MTLGDTATVHKGGVGVTPVAAPKRPAAIAGSSRNSRSCGPATTRSGIGLREYLSDAFSISAFAVPSIAGLSALDAEPRSA
jgi:hypothetical protein